MHILPQTVQEALRSPGIYSVACSGGPDSVALLIACVECGYEVSVAHVNHQMRGQESDDDEAFVAELAKKHNLKFESVRISLPDVNVEAAARKARYEWFDTLDASWIATGHTLDDQAETVLHRIIRGTGLQGLQGIRDENRRILRPLLSVTRADVLDYLKLKNQEYRTDSSNADPRFTRNRIRHEVMPLLKSMNPNIVRNLQNLSRQASEAFIHIWNEAEIVLEKAEKPKAGDLVILDLDVLIRYETEDLLLREMFRNIWRREGWPTDRMTYDRWEDLTWLVIGFQQQLDLPGGISARRAGNVVQLGPRA